MNSEDMFERLMTYIADLNHDVSQRDAKINDLERDKAKLESDVRMQRVQIEATRSLDKQLATDSERATTDENMPF